MCADCRLPLISRTAYEYARVPLPFSDDLVEVSMERISWIKRFAEALADAGIRCYVRPVGAIAENDLGMMGTSSYYHALYVRPEHEAAARRIERGLVGEAAGEEVAEEAATCPACGTPRRADAEECAECGLFLGEPPR